MYDCSTNSIVRINHICVTLMLPSWSSNQNGNNLEYCVYISMVQLCKSTKIDCFKLVAFIDTGI